MRERDRASRPPNKNAGGAINTKRGKRERDKNWRKGGTDKNCSSARKRIEMNGSRLSEM